MEKIIEKVIEKLNLNLEASGEFVQFNDSKYDSVKISKENFSSINDAEGTIAFIDGGNNTILESTNFCLQAARIYYSIYSKNKRLKSRKMEFFILASSSNNSISTETIGVGENKCEFEAFDKTLAVQGHRITPSITANAVRKLEELKEAIRLVDELKEGDVILLDRDLQATITGEKEILDKLYDTAFAKGVIVCGIAKTTRLFTETGGSAITAINSIAPEGEWMYNPIVKVKNENHVAEIYFVKLYSNSKYVFRFEIFEKQKEHVDKVLGILKQNSRDPVFLGYPYGMIEADKFARMSNQEAEYLKTRILAKSGKKASEIADCMKSIDAHSILDSIS